MKVIELPIAVAAGPPTVSSTKLATITTGIVSPHAPMTPKNNGMLLASFYNPTIGSQLTLLLITLSCAEPFLNSLSRKYLLSNHLFTIKLVGSILLNSVILLTSVQFLTICLQLLQLMFINFFSSS
jgi:hypothetical protein